MNFNPTKVCNDLGHNVYNTCSDGIDPIHKVLTISAFVIFGVAFITSINGIFKTAKSIHRCAGKSIKEKINRSNLYEPLEDVINDNEFKTYKKVKKTSWTVVKRVNKSLSTVALFAIASFAFMIAFYMFKGSQSINQKLCHNIGNRTSKLCDSFLTDIVHSITGHK